MEKKQSLADFQPYPKYQSQLTGYVQGLRQQYPEAQIQSFVIYCFGNQGFRIFELSGSVSTKPQLKGGITW